MRRDLAEFFLIMGLGILGMLLGLALLLLMVLVLSSLFHLNACLRPFQVLGLSVLPVLALGWLGGCPATGS